MKRFEEKVFLGFGTASGMGKATAQLFAKDGAKVVIADLQKSQGEKVVQEIIAEGGEAIFIPVDCTQEKDIIKAAEQTIQKFGCIDMMLYQPGAGHSALILDDDIDSWKWVFELNVFGAARAIKSVGKYMKEQGKGAIVVTSSINSFVPVKENAAYCSSKGAIAQLVKVAAMELGPQIRVNAINPGLTDTPSIKVLTQNYNACQVAYKNIVMERVGKPEEFATTARFLLSDDASYITGVSLTCDGGISLYGYPDLSEVL